MGSLPQNKVLLPYLLETEKIKPEIRKNHKNTILAQIINIYLFLSDKHEIVILFLSISIQMFWVLRLIETVL